MRRFGTKPARLRVRRPLSPGTALVGLVLAVAAACGGDREAALEEAQANLEAQFGRRDAPPTEPGTPDPETPEVDGAQADRSPAEATPTPDDPAGASEQPTPEAPAGADGPGDVTGADPAAGLEPGPPVETDEGPAPSVPSGQDPDAILARADAAYEGITSLRATFHQRIENPLLGRTREGEGVWSQAGRDRFSMAFTDPAGDVFVADGSCFWGYEPSLQAGQVMVQRLDEASGIETVDILGRLLSEAQARYTATYVASETLDGSATHHLSLVPTTQAEYRQIEVWIAESDYLVRRFRIQRADETIRTVSLSALEPQARIEPGVFAFSPPEGVQVFPNDVRCD